MILKKILLLLLFLSHGNAFGFDLGHAISFSLDEIRVNTIPQDLQTSLAVGVSQAVAGGFGGLLSRGTARAMGDIKIDPLSSKVSITSAFFGFRSLIRSLFFFFGIPAPVAVGLATLIASVLSEKIKALNRVKGDAEVLLDEDEKLSFSEAVGDISTWVLFDILITYYTGEVGLIGEELASFGYGAFAGVFGLIITKVMDFYIKSEGRYLFNSNYEELIAFQALEGAILFSSYTLMFELLEMYLPQDFNKKFVFDQILQDMQNLILRF